MANVNARGQQTRMGGYFDTNCNNLLKQAATLNITAIVFTVITIIVLIAILIITYAVKTQVLTETVKLRHIGWLSIVATVFVVLSAIVLGILGANGRRARSCIPGGNLDNTNTMGNRI